VSVHHDSKVKAITTLVLFRL